MGGKGDSAKDDSLEGSGKFLFESSVIAVVGLKGGELHLS